jgi:hypothetical protein
VYSIKFSSRWTKTISIYNLFYCTFCCCVRWIDMFFFFFHFVFSNKQSNWMDYILLMRVTGMFVVTLFIKFDFLCKMSEWRVFVIVEAIEGIYIREQYFFKKNYGRMCELSFKKWFFMCFKGFSNVYYFFFGS